MQRQHHYGDAEHQNSRDETPTTTPAGVSLGTAGRLGATTHRNGSAATRWPGAPGAGAARTNGRPYTSTPAPGAPPRSGDVLRVTRSASVQFSSPLLFRVIRVHDWSTYDGWVWLDGYELNATGEAVERRSIFVQVGGLEQVRPPGLERSRVRQPVN